MSDDDTSRVPGKQIKQDLLFGAPYEVGYRKPPVATRFQKGTSGNPQGRRRKQTTELVDLEILELYKTILAEGRRVVSGAESKAPVTAHQAVLKAQFKSAMQGNAAAQRDSLASFAAAEAMEQTVLATEHRLMEEYVACCRRQTAEAKRRGDPLPEHLPHPDDVVIKPGQPVHIAGPVTPDQRDAVRLLEELRDALLLQCAMEDSVRRKRSATQEETATLLMAMLINQRLPGRYCLDDGQLLARLAWCDMAMTQRQLLKAAFQAWRNIGIRLPRGTILPPRSHLVARARQIIDGSASRCEA